MSLIQDQSSSRSSSSSLSSSNNKHTIHVQRLRLTKITRLEPADIYNCYFRGCSQYQDTKETALLWSCLCGAASITARWIDHDRIVHYMEGSSNVHLQLNNKDVPEKCQQLFRRQMVQKCKLADFFLFLLQDTSDPKARTSVAQNILMYYCKPHPTPGLTNGHDFIRKIIQPNDLEAIKNKCNEIIDSFNSSMIPRVRRSRAKSVCIEPTASSASLSLLTSPPPPLSSSASDDTGRLNRRKSSAKRSVDLSDPTLPLSLSSSSFVAPSPAAKRRNSIGMEEDESVMTLLSAIIKHMDVFYIPLSALWQFLKAKYLLTNKENIKQNRFKKDIAEMLPTMLWTDFERQDRNCIQALTKFVDIEKVENVLTINSITRFISVKQNTLKDETNAQDRKLNIKALYLFLNYCSQHELFFVPMDDGKSDTGSISLLEDMMESSTWITTLFNKLGTTFHKMWIDDDDRQLLTYFNLKPLNIRPKNILASMYKNDTLTIQYIFALLKNHIMGQDAGLDIVARALYSVLMSLDPSSADSSFNILLPMMLLFTGLPGTGKTTLMKEIGRLFGVENTPAFVFISGDTHTSEADVTQITGAPPGLVGYDGVGTFVHKVKKLVEYAEQVRNVVPVIAIDELQSFHPKVLTVLRSLFAEGVIYSSKNEKITLPAGSIILIGGNLGKDKYLEALNNGINVTNEQLIRWATQEIISLFGDQLYSRIRTIIPFKVADEDALKNIILQTITTEIGAIRNHIQVTVEDDVIEQLIRIHEYRSGIRKLNHVIREMVRLHLFVLSRKIIDQLTNVVIKIVNIENEEDGGSKVMIGLVEPSNTNRIISSYELVISSKKDAMDDAGDNELGSIISSDDMEIESKTQSSPIPSISLKHPTSPPRVKIPSSSSSASFTRSRTKSLVSLSHPYDYQYSMNSPLSSSSSSSLLFSNDPYTATMTNNNGSFRLSPLMSDDMHLSDLSLPPFPTLSEELTNSS